MQRTITKTAEARPDAAAPPSMENVKIPSFPGLQARAASRWLSDVPQHFVLGSQRFYRCVSINIFINSKRGKCIETFFGGSGSGAIGFPSLSDHRGKRKFCRTKRNVEQTAKSQWRPSSCISKEKTDFAVEMSTEVDYSFAGFTKTCLGCFTPCSSFVLPERVLRSLHSLV